MKTRVLINGAQGKMGRIACEALKNHPEFEIVAELGRNEDLEQGILKSKAQIVIELTRADCVYKNSLCIITNNVHPIIGASGLVESQIYKLQNICAQKKLGGLIAPNFSMGAILMMHFAKIAARFLPNVEIIEAHHPQKQDAPSGTALKTAALIAKARPNPAPLHEHHELLPGARGAQQEDISIHSIRLPGFLAYQNVIFGNLGETLSLTHNTLDRSAFIPGILLACQQVSTLDQLYYGLEHLLDLGE